MGLFGAAGLAGPWLDLQIAHYWIWQPSIHVNFQFVITRCRAASRNSGINFNEVCICDCKMPICLPMYIYICTHTYKSNMYIDIDIVYVRMQWRIRPANIYYNCRGQGMFFWRTKAEHGQRAALTQISCYLPKTKAKHSKAKQSKCSFSSWEARQ